MKDKEQTKRRLIDAVGVIVKTKGFKALRISKVAREAGVDRKLVYRYFGNMNNLTEAYISENDYWMLFAEHLKSVVKDLSTDNIQQMITEILQEFFRYFSRQKEMQNLIMLELIGSNDILHSIHNARESLGQQFLESTDVHFKNSNVNFRAVSALLIGGIYYMILHTRGNGYNFADLNLKSEDGISAILKTLAQIVDWAFIAAGQG